MKVTVFALWENEEILTEAEREERISELAAGMEEDEDYLDQFLSDEKELGAIQAFRLSEAEKTEMMEEFRGWCQERAASDFDYDYESVELEI